MNFNLKNAYILLILVIAWVLIWLGAVGKIASWPMGGQLLTLGLFMQAFGCLLGILKVFLMKKTNGSASHSSRYIPQTKYIVLIILIGIIISSFGAVAKISSMPSANMFLKIGFIVQCVGYVFALIQLLNLKSVRDFLKS